jgi:hypothetical protein
MCRLATICFAVVALTCFTGCPAFVRITNNGPNAVEITGMPSPVEPDFPHELAPGGVVSIDFAGSPVTIQVVDKTTNASGRLEDLDLLEGNFGSNNFRVLDLEWTGTELVNHGFHDQ